MAHALFLSANNDGALVVIVMVSDGSGAGLLMAVFASRPTGLCWADRPRGCGLRPGLFPATASPSFFPAPLRAAPRETTSPAPAVLRCAAARLGAGRPSPRL
jgi:hypothetical protein